MAEIRPDTLRSLRKQRRLTLDTLAEKAGVDKQTIHRLESGQTDHPRNTTLERLAKALDVEADALAGSIDEGEAAAVSEPSKSQINLRISNRARNALLLVCERYHVRPAQIVELAPLLFNWAAEKCFQRFDERFEALQAQASQISDAIERFNSDNLNLFGDSPAPNPFLDADLEMDMHFADFGLFGGRHDAATPISDLLDELVSEMNESSPTNGEQAEFAGWYANSSPDYSICKQEATWLADGDEVALENLLKGYAPLHELPKEFWEQLRNRNTLGDEAVRQREAAERVEWFRAHGRPDDSLEAAS
jgi:transcriptional regulator with XRE-family HTH domain